MTTPLTFRSASASSLAALIGLTLLGAQAVGCVEIVDPVQAGPDAGAALGADAGAEGDEGGTVVVTLTSDLALPAGSSAHVVLLGFDSGWADQSADILVRGQATADAFPVEVELTLPANLHEGITVGGEDPDAARYYYAVAVDVDGDEMLCGTDFSQDYDQTDFVAFPRNTLGSVSVAMMQRGDILGCTDLP